MSKTRLWCVIGFSLLLSGGLMVSGCGGSSSDSASETQLEKAKEEGERIAKERARINDLEKEVRSLKRSARHTEANNPPPAVPAASTPDSESGSGAEPLRTFHAPSGNVSCVISLGGAFCTVNSIATTFRVEDGGAGWVESGSALPRGYGELAEYGSTVNAGTVTCTIPKADEPRGITCIDNSSGHGFEASRISSRQDTF